MNMPKISQTEIKKKLEKMLTSEEGIITILAASFALSDFDDSDIAIKEAIKTFNSNQAYFKRIIEKQKNQ